MSASATSRRRWCVSSLGRRHAERANALAREVIAERIEEGLNSRTFGARLHQQEIVFLGRNRDKAELIKLGDRFDADAPIGALLRDRGSHSVVRFWLIGIAGRLRAAEQFVDQ